VLASIPAVNVAFNSVALTTVVARAVPFQVITVVATKPDPVTPSRTSLDPATTLAGLTLLIVGTGLFTVKSTPGELPPPGDGFTTVSFATVPLAKLLAGIVALKLVAEIYVVARETPFHCAVELRMNPDPLITTLVFPEPAKADPGVTPEMAGVGFALGAGGEMGPGVPPPPAQPAVKQTQVTAQTTRTRVGRSMKGFPC